MGKIFNYTKKVGDLLVIMIADRTATYIAEVTRENPLQVKVKEIGSFTRLNDDDFMILESDSEQIQDDKRSTDLLKEYADRNCPLRSGLKKLGVKDGKLHEILPVPAKA